MSLCLPSSLSKFEKTAALTQIEAKDRLRDLPYDSQGCRIEDDATGGRGGGRRWGKTAMKITFQLYTLQ